MASPTSSSPSPTNRMELLRKAEGTRRQRQWASGGTSSVNSGVTKDDTVSTTSESTDATNIDRSSRWSSTPSQQEHKDLVKSRLAKAMSNSNHQISRTPQQHEASPAPRSNSKEAPKSNSKSQETTRPYESLTQRRRRAIGQMRASSPLGRRLATTNSPPSDEKKASSTERSKTAERPSPFARSPQENPNRREEAAVRVMNGSTRPVYPETRGTNEDASPSNEIDRRTKSPGRLKSPEIFGSPVRRTDESPFRTNTKPPMAPPTKPKSPSPFKSPSLTVEVPAMNENGSTTVVIANGRAEIETPQSASVASLRASFANNNNTPIMPPSRGSSPKTSTPAKPSLAVDYDEEEKKSSDSISPQSSSPWSSNKSNMDPQDNQTPSSVSERAAAWNQKDSPNKKEIASEIISPPVLNHRKFVNSDDATMWRGGTRGDNDVSPEKSRFDPKRVDGSATPDSRSSFPSWMIEKKFPSGVHDGKPSPPSVVSAPSDEGSTTQFPSWMTQQKFAVVKNGKPSLSDAGSPTEKSVQSPSRVPAWMKTDRFPSVHDGKPSWKSRGEMERKPKEEPVTESDAPQDKPVESTMRSRKTWPPHTDVLKDSPQTNKSKPVETDTTPSKPKVSKFRRTWSGKAEIASPPPREETVEKEKTPDRHSVESRLAELSRVVNNSAADDEYERVIRVRRSVKSQWSDRNAAINAASEHERDNTDVPPTESVTIALYDDEANSVYSSDPRPPLQRADESSDDKEIFVDDEETLSETPSKSLTQMAMDSVFAIDYQKLIAMELHPDPSLSFDDDDTISTARSKELPLTPAQLPSELQHVIDEKKEEVSDAVVDDRSPGTPVPRLPPSPRDKDHQRDHARSRGSKTSPPEERDDKYHPSEVETEESTSLNSSGETTPPRYSQATDHHLTSEHLEEIRGMQTNTSTEAHYGSDVSSSVIFGDPTTFGAAADDVPGGSPPVSERARAIEDWNGGRGTEATDTPPGSFPSSSDYDNYYSPPDDDSPSKIRAQWSPPEEETSPSKIRESWSPPTEEPATLVAERAKEFENWPHRSKTPEKGILRDSSPNNGSTKKGDSQNRVRFSEPPAPRFTDEYGRPLNSEPDRYADEWDDAAAGVDRNEYKEGADDLLDYWSSSKDDFRDGEADEWMHRDPDFHSEMKEEEDEWVDRDPDLVMPGPDSPASSFSPSVDRYQAMNASPAAPKSNSRRRKQQQSTEEDPFTDKTSDSYEAVRLSTPPSVGKKAFDPFFSGEAMQENFDFDGDNSFFSNEENSSFFSGNDSNNDVAFDIDPSEDIFPTSSSKKKSKKSRGGAKKLLPPPIRPPRGGTPTRNRRGGGSSGKDQFGEKPGELLEI